MSAVMGLAMLTLGGGAVVGGLERVLLSVLAVWVTATAGVVAAARPGPDRVGGHVGAR